MRKIQLKKVRRITMNEWEYNYGTQRIIVHRTYPAQYHAFVHPRIQGGQEIFRISAGDLHHFIREFKRHLERIEKQIHKPTENENRID